MGSTSSLLKFRSPSRLGLFVRRIFLPHTLLAWTGLHLPDGLPFRVTPSLKQKQAEREC
jgi:hypothetical protein